MTPLRDERVAGSFRDPSGFVFFREGQLYRQVNSEYRENFELLTSSGLHESLVGKGLVVSFEEVDIPPHDPETADRILKPEEVPFVSYPYEWCFGQLKDSALTTLAIQKLALEHGMSLKDASAYNIQFLKGKPVLIDNLSFDRYEEGTPWVAYNQFCRHFLAPLALMAYCDIRLGQLLRVNIDGIPLDLTSKLLPRRTWMTFSLLTNIHLHAASQRRAADKGTTTGGKGVMSKRGLLGLIDSLETRIRKLKWSPGNTVWGDYYSDTNYSREALDHKRQLVSESLNVMTPISVWDMGANTGLFSRLASERGAYTVAFDMDSSAVEANYLECRKKGDDLLLPLMLDLSNPSPDLGWAHRERMSLRQRGPADLVMALALVHHLAIGNNVPLSDISRFFGEIGRALIIEFVPKEDSQIQRMLANREDVFPDYDRAHFEKAFSDHFHIKQTSPIRDSKRTLYLMTRL
ncbi:MAG: SAM-dependent methyltransferase [candidate division Zixibacteria bacterium]|nr:SAM-dependent methyltransferase [candidate division Zixibacteria bacterium]